jgi:hypothetical protein
MFDLLQVLLADLHSVEVVFGIEVQLISYVVLSFVEKTACMFVLAFRNHGLFVFLLKLLFAGFYLSISPSSSRSIILWESMCLRLMEGIR